MIWLLRTTDNSTYFAESLEIRGIESGLYLFCSITQWYVLYKFVQIVVLWSKGPHPACHRVNMLIFDSSAIGWSVVCECDIYWSYSFFTLIHIVETYRKSSCAKPLGSEP